jgi:5'-methylthioadenosine phosphorylase
MPEAKLAREAQICYALIALPSDYDCWRPPLRLGSTVLTTGRSGQNKKLKDKQTLLKEIIANLQTATKNCLELIKAVLHGGSGLVCEDCSCRKSLDLAVWTDQSQIKTADKEKLKVLFE